MAHVKEKNRKSPDNSYLAENTIEPRKFDETEILHSHKRLKHDFELVMFTINSTTFQERVEGEKRILKRKIIEFGTTSNIKLISIDNAKELYFMVKSIHEQVKRKEGNQWKI